MKKDNYRMLIRNLRKIKDIEKTKEELIKKMLDKKAQENNLIDLDAYCLGLNHMYDFINKQQ